MAFNLWLEFIQLGRGYLRLTTAAEQNPAFCGLPLADFE
jgi:hypothetical protein